jgi:dihydroflavonol-4-reductase
LRAAAAGAPVVVASPTVPIGPHDGPPTSLAAMLNYFLESRIRGYLDFAMNVVDVRDVAEGLILALERGRVGERYILGGETVRLSELLRRAAMLTGRSSLRIPIPGALAQVVAAGMEFVADHVTHRPPAATVEGVRIALRAVPVSLEKSRRELGYACRPIEPALRQAIASIMSDRKRSGPG